MRMLKGYPIIKKILFETYYDISKGFSDVTSSHWREIGGHDVKYNANEFVLSGTGFGDFIKKNIINWLLYFPEKFLLKNLLKKYLSNRLIAEKAVNIAKKQGRLLDFDCVKQILALDLILKKINLRSAGRGDMKKNNEVNTCVVIGDGYGFMTCLIKEVLKDCKIININLGKTLLFDVYYVEKNSKNISVALFEQENDARLVNNSDADIVFIAAENYEVLKNIDANIYINIASMQEMDINIINKYFELMRENKGNRPYLYCCNREQKKLPDGQLINYADYGWKSEDEILTDELCPWYQFFPSKLPPFWRPFDGPIRHRLVRLAP